MNQQLLQLIIALSVASADIYPLNSQPSVEQQTLMVVNSGWSDIELTNSQSIQVAQCGSYEERIQMHLTLVAERLIEQTATMNISAEARVRRLALIDTLADYAAQATFPKNNERPYPTPVFLDDEGVHCAVGYLLHASGQDQLVGKIANENNLAYIRQLDDLYPEIGQWADFNGFAIEELAWIQPKYVYFCNPEIERGEVIHVSCYGDCTGAFYPDYTIIDLPPGELLAWDDTYEWNEANYEWVKIGIPDCLCPGRYRQAFQVNSPEGDSLYSVYIEAEILGPEQITGNAWISGEAGLCRAYVEPIGFGGVAPYTFDVMDIEGDSYGLGPLCEGYYFLEIRDVNGCIVHELLQVYTPESDCMAFSVQGIAFSDQKEDALTVSIKVEGDSSSYISLPFYAEVIDSEGNTLAWSLNTFNQYGGEQQTFLFETIKTPFSLKEAQNLHFGFNETFCVLPVPSIPTSIADLSEVSVSLYPNPMSDASILSWKSTTQESRCQLFDIQGQLLRSWTAYDQNTTLIERENLPQGLYTILVTTEFGTGACRMVVLD